MMPAFIAERMEKNGAIAKTGMEDAYLGSRHALRASFTAT